MAGIFKIIVAFFVFISSTVSNAISTTLVHDIPEPLSGADFESLYDVFDEYPVADKIVVINRNCLTTAQYQTLICLQGIVAKTKAEIFIDNNSSSSKKTLLDLTLTGKLMLLTDSEGKEWTFESVLEKFRTSVGDNGYVLYSGCEDYDQLNTATNYATLYGWLAVPAELEQTVKAAGLEMKKDISGDDINPAYLLAFYDEHKSSFRNDVLLHQRTEGTYGLRDLAIQQNIFVTYVLEDDFFGKCYRNEIFEDLEPGSMILGWGQYEIAFVESATAAGHYVIPSDHCVNNSILSSVEVRVPAFNEPVGDITLDPSKHYVVLLYSDGDNAQWVQGGYNEYYTWKGYDMDVPVTWSFPPLMEEFSSVDTRRVMAFKGDDCFVCGPSGAGYTRMSKMYGDGLAATTNMTASAMLNSGMTTVTILDSIYENAVTEKAFINKLGYYARYENINGGICQLDGERYAAGHGKVFFVNDKPFVSVRLSLWYPGGEGSAVPAEWLEQQAEIVNSYPADINSINGYSVINIHPWTVSTESLRHFVNHLDDGVEVITGDELIAALDKYIPHETAEPAA